MTLPAEWLTWSRTAAEADARVHGFGLKLHRRIRELDVDSGSCFAAVRTLARAVGCHERTVQRWLRKLERWGYVLRVDRVWPSGMRRSHVLVPVAPVEVIGEDRVLLQRQRATEHTDHCASGWLPSWGLRAAPPPSPRAPSSEAASRGDTRQTVTNRSSFAECTNGGWGEVSGPGPGDPGWEEPHPPPRRWRPPAMRTVVSDTSRMVLRRRSYAPARFTEADIPY